MIAKVSKGSGFLGVLQYVMNEEKGRFLTTNLITKDGVTPKSFAQQLARTKELNGRVKKPVFHVAISLEKDAKIDDKKFIELGNKFMKMYGFNAPGKGETLYVMARHTDTNNPHIHIVASRIDTEGFAHNPSNDYKLINDITRKLEKEYGFKIVTNTSKSSKEIPRNELKMAERIRSEGGKYVNHRGRLINKIEPFLEPVGGGKRPFKSFVRELHKQGVSIQFNTDKDVTRINGISFSYNYKGEDIKYKGSALGKGYTWASIISKIDFKPDDMKMVEQIQNGERPGVNVSSSSSIDLHESENANAQGQNIGEKIINSIGKMGKTHTGGGQYVEEDNKKKKRRRRKL